MLIFIEFTLQVKFISILGIFKNLFWENQIGITAILKKKWFKDYIVMI